MENNKLFGNIIAWTLCIIIAISCLYSFFKFALGDVEAFNIQGGRGSMYYDDR